ncbi:glycosyltransferase [Hymenobacter baengnokdamensis]|uniref:glycosyltransferase n=1 Tax=Hymenobacter baengnokdamensis TaxID=2615203 RepID=UPI0012462ED2|nr:glycosyltransferase [Hymenobacter baengnokdamensis]
MLTSAAARPHLLMIIPNRGLGGAQRAFHDHGVALREFYDVTEVIFNEDEPDLYPSGNAVRSLGVPGGGGPVAKLKNFYARVAKLQALKRELNCDVAISHLEGADYVNLLSKGREKVILLIQGSKVHDGEIKGGLGWLRKRLLMPWLYHRADRVVTVSRDIIPEMTEAFGVPAERLMAINNSFEVEQVRERSQEPLAPAIQTAIYDTGPVLVTSGRLAVQKNQAPLLEVFAILLKQQPAKLVFIGDGELRDELSEQARALGLRTWLAWENAPLAADYQVYFVGLQSNPFQFIRPAQIFVFPSAWEGFPLALGEAMTCGVACVTADCPTGPREMLAPDSSIPTKPIRQAEWTPYGVLMPMLTSAATLAADQAVWVATLAQLLGDTAEQARLGQQAYERALDFSHANTFRRWRQLIDATLASK